MILGLQWYGFLTVNITNTPSALFQHIRNPLSSKNPIILAIIFSDFITFMYNVSINQNDPHIILKFQMRLLDSVLDQTVNHQK